MKVFSRRLYYGSAENTCINLKGGSSEDQPGWLMIISDSDTDQFVKSLLNRGQKAYIGLYKDNNTFSWKSGYRDNATYRGWKDRQPGRRLIRYYKYTTISKEGWESSMNKTRPYICQMYPALPPPSITCPPSEEGTSNLEVKCEIPKRTSYGKFENAQIAAYGKYPALVCTHLNCARFFDNLSGNTSEDNGGNTLTATFMLDRPVNRSDDGQKWSSKYKYERSSEFVLFADCIMRTYVVPQSLTCSSNYTTSNGFTITCDVHGVYPKAKSIWVHFINSFQQSSPQIQAQHEAYTEARLPMFKSKFTMQINGEAKTRPGKQTIEVTVYPDVPFLNMEKRLTASLRKTIEVHISVPNQSPVFYNGSGLDVIQDMLTVNSGQTITLVCKAGGGYPPLYDIRISCNDTVRDSSGKNTWSSPGQQVSVVLPISLAMDQKMCYCSANHVSGQYKKKAHVTLNVWHAAGVVSFTKNGQKGEFEASENETIKLRCSALGNPKPKIILFQSHSDGRKSSILRQTFGNVIEFNISQGSCDKSGTYVCAAKNILSTETSERRVDVRVKCRPHPCSESDYNREFSVVPNTHTEVTLCVFSNPQPNNYIILRSIRATNFSKTLFHARFVYTDPVKSKGNIMVNMSESIVKFGNFIVILYQTGTWYYIPFSLVPYQKPSCPPSLNIDYAGSSFVVLSWTPAPDRGISQTFIVSQTDAEGIIVKMTDVEDIGDPQMFHNITGLIPVSEYWFNLSVKNIEGVTDCPQLVANATTHALPLYQKPLCPESLEIAQIGNSFVVLSWTPAPDRGISQTFIVSQIDAEDIIVKMTDVEDIGDPQMFHNITSLDPGNECRFSLSVKNVAGITDCPRLKIDVKTPVFDGSYDNSVYHGLVWLGVTVFTLAMVLCIVIVKKKKWKMKPQRQCLSLNCNQNSPITLENDKKRRKAIETNLSPAYHSTNTKTELLMPAKDFGYIEMRASRGHLNVSITNIHVESTDRTAQTSSGDDAGYIEMRDVRGDIHFQNQSNDAVDNICGESEIMKGEHKGKNIAGWGIDCKHQASINDSYTGSSRKKCADTIVKQQCADTTSNEEYAVAYTQLTNARDNKEYINAIAHTQCTNATANKEYANAIAHTQCTNATANTEYANAIAHTQCSNTTANKEYANVIACTQCTNATANKEYANAIAYTQCPNATANKEYANVIACTQCTNATANKEYANAIAYTQCPNATANKEYANVIAETQCTNGKEYAIASAYTKCSNSEG
ncbi:hemicentin-1-like [Plakobranchus ocellatus]|uniref:Hemicentin-1-like n=1 Tax=Plakobranchus ocellatus TaxID=259542 RepID=A0AAV3ZC30_9GAST|nr:hemicentin-1-like [Plakobranchus ocellatus]